MKDKIKADTNVRIQRNRTLRWRGDFLEDSRIQVTTTVERYDVRDVLAKSGRHGMLMEFAPEFRYCDDLVRVRMPPNMDLQAVNARIDSMDARLRNKIIGVVPTPQGYAIRVPKWEEAEITNEVNPKMAADMGGS